MKYEIDLNLDDIHKMMTQDLMEWHQDIVNSDWTYDIKDAKILKKVIKLYATKEQWDQYYGEEAEDE